ncbi:MAG: glutaredoxin family protein [Solirubrobacteraceae bacterium]
MKRVTLYGRPGCCLCDEARDQLLALQHRVPFSLEERDIESDDRLLAAYLERIPVIAVEDDEVCELFLDEPRLLRRLRDGGTGTRLVAGDDNHGSVQSGDG